MFKGDKVVSKRIDGLNNNELYKLFEDFYNEYHRPPSTTDTNYKDYNIYRTFNRIKNSEVRLQLRPKIMSLFYEFEESTESTPTVEEFVKNKTEDFKIGVAAQDVYKLYLEYCGSNKPLRQAEFRNELKKYCKQERTYKDPRNPEKINTLAF